MEHVGPPTPATAADRIDDAAVVGDDVYALPRAEVRRRSLAGVFYLTSSSIANLVVGFFSTLVIARILTPHDFGVVAVGSTAILIAGALADGGLGAGMVRRAEPPTRQELRTLNGIQLALALAICCPAVGVALFFGRTGAVTALMIISIPITTLQTPGRIVLSREMAYDRQLAIDFGSQTLSQVVAVVSVVLGAGVWGLAAAAVVKAAVSTALTASLSIGLVGLSLRRWKTYGSLVRFGIRFQATWYAFVGREQGLNLAIGAVGGVVPLGIWTFANRLFQLPSVAFSSLYVVGFPAMSNLLSRGEDPRPIILRTTRRATIVGAFIFPPFGAVCSIVVPVVFGAQWSDASQILPFVCISTLILGGLSVGSTSYLSAVGRPGVVALAAVAFGGVWIALAALLLPLLGPAGIGLGNLVGALVEATILDRATKRACDIAPHRPLVLPAAIGILAGAVGWWMCSRSGGLPAAFAGGGVTVALTFFGLRLFCRNDFDDTLRLATSTVSGIVPRLRSATG